MNYLPASTATGALISSEQDIEPFYNFGGIRHRH